jgi:hypothetical protein
MPSVKGMSSSELVDELEVEELEESGGGGTNGSILEKTAVLYLKVPVLNHGPAPFR